MSETKISVFSQITPPLFFACLLSSLGAFNASFDSSWWGGAIGLPPFQHHFGTGRTAAGAKVLTPTDISNSFALGTAGVMIGSMVAPFISGPWGRRWLFFSVGVIGSIGTLVQALATFPASYWMLVVGKIVVSISVGMVWSTAGLYCAEVTPRRLRGAAINAYGMSLNFGGAISNIVMYGVSTRTDLGVWMVPIGIQFLAPVVLLICGLFLPESPRWLISKGRYEDAYVVLRRLRGPKAPKEDIDAQIQEIDKFYKHELSLQEGTSYTQLFKGTDLRRTLIAIGVECLQQAQGGGFMFSYIIVTMLALGYTDTYKLQAILFSAQWFTTLLGFYLPDVIGRRKTLIAGSMSMGACFFIIGAVSSATDNNPTGSLGRLALAAIFCWFFFNSFTWLQTPLVVASEVSSNHLREKTVALGVWSGNGVGLISQFVSPYMQDDQYAGWGAKIAYLWGGFCVVAIFYVYYLVPELKGRSMEQIDILFERRLGARHFQREVLEQPGHLHLDNEPESNGSDAEVKMGDSRVENYA